jgi:hypothetical protein
MFGRKRTVILSRDEVCPRSPEVSVMPDKGTS